MKTVQKIFCILLVVTLLLPCVVLPLNAAGADPIDNLYDVENPKFGTAPQYSYDNCVENDLFCSSGVISVREGDTITVGPVIQSDAWFIRSYNDSCETVKSVTRRDCTEEASLCGNVKIYTYTVPKGIRYICVTNSYTFYDCTVVTKNRTFTAEEYLSYMDEQRISVDFLKPATVAAADATNRFTVDDSIVLGDYEAVKEGAVIVDLTEKSRSRQRSHVYNVGSGEGDLEPGDVIYVVSLNSEKSDTTLFSVWLEDNKYTQVKAEGAILYEDLGRNYSIYAFRVPEAAEKIGVTISAGDYDEGLAFMTVNEAFSGESYRAHFGIDLDEDFCDESSPLYGLKGLFLGDSICYGSHDAISYEDDPENWRAWAGGISAATGMISTNNSWPGAKISYRPSDIAKQERYWVWNQQDQKKNESFDVVVMQGGVNDAGNDEIDVGYIRPVTSTFEELNAEGVKDTYLGGLQLLFHTVKQNWPNATHFFIANYLLGPSKSDNGQRPALGEWFKEAEKLCEMYGVHFIDLYNNDELTEKLNYPSKDFIHDHTHPNRPGYDIVTPYIQAEMERVMAEKQAEDETTGEKIESGDLTGPDGGTTAEPDAGADEGSTPSDEKNGCGSVVTATLGFTALVLLSPVAFVLRKKEIIE